MLLATETMMIHDKYITLSSTMSKDEVKSYSRDINDWVERANLHFNNIYVPELDQLIKTRQAIKCNHLMQSCINEEDPVLEILYKLKAAESSTCGTSCMNIFVDIRAGGSP